MNWSVHRNKEMAGNHFKWPALFRTILAVLVETDRSKRNSALITSGPQTYALLNGLFIQPSNLNECQDQYI